MTRDLMNVADTPIYFDVSVLWRHLFHREKCR